MGKGYQFGSEPGLIDILASAESWKTIFFIRHAETQMNVAGGIDGLSESILTKTGERQAERLSSLLQRNWPALFDPSLTQVISSPAIRAVETASRVFGERDFSTDSGFLEVNAGLLQGISLREGIDRKLIFPQHSVWDAFPEGESYAQAQLRAMRAIEKYLPLASSNIVIVAHGGIIALMVLALMRLPVDRFPLSVIDNASCTIVEVHKTSDKIFSKLKVVNQQP